MPNHDAAQIASKKLTTAQREELSQQAIQRFEDILVPAINHTRSFYRSEAIRELYATCTDDSIIAIHEHIMADLPKGSHDFLMRNQLLRTLTNGRHAITGTTVHEYLTFKASLPSTEGTPHKALDIISALHGYNQLPAIENYADADTHTKTQISALLTITEELDFEYQLKKARATKTISSSPTNFGIPLTIETGPRIHGDDLIDLILDRPHCAHEIARSILRDGIIDTRLLRDIYTSSNPALRDGII